jgi:tetratricopeptide (TPR) repeat protein
MEVDQMKIIYVTALAALLSAAVWAQRPKFDFNTATPEGRLLQMAGSETDEARKLALFEEFVKSYPKHGGTAWAYSQLQPIYLKAQQWDKSIQAAEAALALDPANSFAAYNALQACEKKNDIACLKDWSARTADAARKMLAIAKPANAAEGEEWDKEIDYANQVIVRCEYSLYAAGLQSTDPAVIIGLGSALEQRHPDSQYIPQLAGRYIMALQQTGQRERAALAAEKAVSIDKTNEDLLAAAADGYLQSKKDMAKVIEFSDRLIAIMQSKAAPQGVAAADWEKKKKTMTGLGHWMKGVAYQEGQKFVETDLSFRTALPFIEGNNDLLAPAYFYLGVANHSLSKSAKNPKLRAEAARYSELCTRIAGPYQELCAKNLKAIKLGK